MVAMDFVTNFHNLQGTSIGDRRRSLFRLFRKHTELKNDGNLLDEVASKLKPKSFLEKIFNVEFLIYFRRYDELVEVFKSGEGLLTSKIAKQDWFFERISAEIQPQYFVNEIMPTMGFAVRIKILKKLRTTEERCDAIFDAVHLRYGLFIACHILEKCSVKKISNIFQLYSVPLTVGQLRLVYIKDPELILEYFEGRAKFGSLSKYNSLFQFIAGRDPDLFCKLNDKYSIEVKIGKKATNKFIALKKADVLAKPQKYVASLSAQILIKKLGPDSKELYYKIFRQQEGFGIPSILKYYPKKLQFTLYKTTFDSIFCKKFGEDLDVIDENTLQIISDVNEREKWAKIMFDYSQNEDYFKYFTAEKCLETVLEKFNVASGIKRVKYVELVAQSCIINSDLDTFLKVCKLVAVRLKNDDQNVRGKFCDIILDNEIMTRQYREEHWKFVLEILATVEAKDEHIYQLESVYYKYLEYLFAQKKSMEDILLQKVHKYPDHGFIYLCASLNPKFYKSYILNLIKLAPQKFPDNKYQEFDLNLVNCCNVYNQKHSDDPIDIYNYPRLIESVTAYLKNDEYYGAHHQTFMYAATRIYKEKEKMQEVEKVMQLYLQSFKKVGMKDALIFILKNKPELIDKYFDEIFVGIHNVHGANSVRVWQFFKKYSHLGLDQKAIQFFIKQLNDGEFSKPEETIRPISVLMPTSDFLKLAEDYKPSQSKVDLQDEKVIKKYKIQIKIALYLRNIKSSKATLPVTLKYCTGDFLSSAVHSLYRALYRVPEDVARYYINVLHQEPTVSVKKHATYLACELLDQKAALVYLKNCTSPKLLLQVFKFFLKNLQDSIFEFFKETALKVTKQETDLLKIVVETRVPTIYSASFYQIIWEVLKKIQDLILIKKLFIKLTEPDIRKLSTGLCNNMIEDCFLKIPEAVTFTAKYLFCHSDFSFVFEFLRTSKGDNWPIQGQLSQKTLVAFLNDVFLLYMSGDNVDSEFAETFAKNLRTVFSPVEAFEAYIDLMKFKGLNEKDLALNVLSFRDNLTTKYGIYVENLLVEILQGRLKHFFENPCDVCRFCYELIKLRTTAENSVFVIQLLPRKVPLHVDCLKYYKDCLILLRELTEEVVQILIYNNLDLSILSEV